MRGVIRSSPATATRVGGGVLLRHPPDIVGRALARPARLLVVVIGSETPALGVVVRMARLRLVVLGIRSPWIAAQALRVTHPGTSIGVQAASRTCAVYRASRSMYPAIGPAAPEPTGP